MSNGDLDVSNGSIPHFALQHVKVKSQTEQVFLLTGNYQGKGDLVMASQKSAEAIVMVYRLRRWLLHDRMGSPVAEQAEQTSTDARNARKLVYCPDSF